MNPSPNGGSKPMVSISPATGETLATFPVHDGVEVRAAVARARSAQQAWKELSIGDRAQQLLGFCEALVSHAEDLVDVISLETSKPRLEALINEILVLADIITWDCKNAPSILAPRTRPLHLIRHRKSRIYYEPRGVIGIISPWNYPLMLPFSEVVAAVVAGNAVVLKPSEHGTLTALRAKRLWDECNMPEHLLEIVTGGGETGAALIDAGVDKVAFTGGAETGRRVAEQCGKNLIECVLELGGKAPMIVCRDADLERTANAIAWGGFFNLGQACVSVERVLAHADIHDELVTLTKGRVESLRQGSPDDGLMDLGASVLEHKLTDFASLVSDALEKGATLETGGKRLERPGNFFLPTLLSHCDLEMRVMKEELFGPIVPIMKVADDDEAVRVANALPYGLSAYIFSKDTTKARRLATRIEAGSVVINDVGSDIGTPDVPFGGIKYSGYGRVHGPEGLRSMCHVKHVSYNRFPLPDRSPFWFPYTEKSFAQTLRGIRMLYSSKGPLGRLAKWL